MYITVNRLQSVHYSVLHLNSVCNFGNSARGCLRIGERRRFRSHGGSPCGDLSREVNTVKTVRPGAHAKRVTDAHTGAAGVRIP